MPSEGVFQCGVELFELKAGEKSQAAHVDWKNGNAERSSHARGSKQSAIAAQHQQELRLLGNLLAGESSGRLVEGGRRFGVVECANAAGFEPVQKAGNDFGEVRPARARNDADSLERGRRVHV